MKKGIFLWEGSIFVKGATVEELRNIQRPYNELPIIVKKTGVKILPPPGESLGNFALHIGEELKTKVSRKKGAPPFDFANTPYHVLRT